MYMPPRVLPAPPSSSSFWTRRLPQTSAHPRVSTRHDPQSRAPHPQHCTTYSASSLLLSPASPYAPLHTRSRPHCGQVRVSVGVGAHAQAAKGGRLLDIVHFNAKLGQDTVDVLRMARRRAAGATVPAMQVRRCAGAQVRRCAGAQVRRCAGAQVRRCAGAQVRRCAGAQVRRCAGAQVRRCAGAQVRRCAGARVRACRCAPMRASPTPAHTRPAPGLRERPTSCVLD